MYNIYVDGSCQDGYGGWGYVAFSLDKTHYLNGGGSEVTTTNNRMEMLAAIQAITAVMERGGKTCSIFTDSRYVCDGITKYVCKWDLSTRKNGDLWVQLVELCKHISINWQWVKGHDNNIWNNYVDHIAFYHALQLKFLTVS